MLPKKQWNVDVFEIVKHSADSVVSIPIDVHKTRVNNFDGFVMPVTSCSQAIILQTNHDAPLELEKKNLQKAGLDHWNLSLVEFPDVQFQEPLPDESLISPALGPGSPQAAYSTLGLGIVYFRLYTMV